MIQLRISSKSSSNSNPVTHPKPFQNRKYKQPLVVTTLFQNSTIETAPCVTPLSEDFQIVTYRPNLVKCSFGKISEAKETFKQLLDIFMFATI